MSVLATFEPKRPAEEEEEGPPAKRQKVLRKEFEHLQHLMDEAWQDEELGLDPHLVPVDEETDPFEEADGI